MHINLNQQLSPHFTLGEMLRSGTALTLNIDNRPTDPAVVEAMTQLCQHPLETLRRRFGRIIVTSGYRCQRLNRYVGGAISSQHLRGEAADIYVSGPEMARRYASYLEEHGQFDQLIVEPRGSLSPRWLHISYTTRRANRHQVLW